MVSVTAVTTLEVTVEHTDGTTGLEALDIEHIKNLGMAYRDPPDRDQLNEYLAEMGAEGEAPERLPSVGPKPNYLVTTERTMQVTSSTTAGEAEFVMYPTEDELYIGVGNDHKEYDLMPGDGRLSNSTCPSVVSDEVWVFDELVDHWDEIQLRSWVEQDGSLDLYQEAPMSAFMRPDAIVEAVDDKTPHPITGTAVWSGTISRSSDGEPGGVDPYPEVISGDFYLIQLYDPVLDRRLVTHYDVHVSE